MRTKSSLESLIIADLARRGCRSFENLREAIRRHRAVSRAGVYKALASLIEQHTIERTGAASYQLSDHYILETGKLLAAALRAPRETTGGLKSLAQLDVEINEIIATWFLSSTDRHAYFQHAPHAWFVLAHRGVEEQIVSRIHGKTRGFYTLVNNATFLDRWIKDFYHCPPKSFYRARRHSKRENDHYFGVYGDYYFECRYPASVTRELEAIYTRATDLYSFSPHDFLALVSTPRRGLNLRHGRDPLRASKLREYVRSQFVELL